jgi:hypothetical protein
LVRIPEWFGRCDVQLQDCVNFWGRGVSDVCTAVEPVGGGRRGSVAVYLIPYVFRMNTHVSKSLRRVCEFADYLAGWVRYCGADQGVILVWGSLQIARPR